MRLTSRLLPVISCALSGAVALQADTGSQSITADEYIAHVRRLADEKMQGRGNGSTQLEEAAEYVAGRFKADGLAPAFSDSYFQPFEITVKTEFAPASKVVVVTDKGETVLDLFTGFLPLGLGEENEISGELVFAGYGIETQNPPYNDFDGIDVKDKVVLLMTHAPREKEGAGQAEDQLALQATLTSKALNARMHGARGVVVVADPTHTEDEREALPPFKDGGAAEEWGLPVVAVHLTAITPLLQAAGKDLSAIHAAIDRDQKPQSFALPGVHVRMSIAATKTRKTVRNVAAVVRGASDEVIVVGAHYDHLGLGEKNSLAPREIGHAHHGADDNASGVAGMLEIAQAFAGTRPPRTIVFVAFAGEELGLLGSSFFVKNPPVAVDKIAAMVNFDMIGRPKGNKIYINGVGTSPGFKSLVEEAGKAAELQLSLSSSGYGSSDQTSFVAKSIPVLFFFSGLHGDYHKPSDTWDKINADAAAKVVKMAHDVVEDLAALTERPTFVRVAEPAQSGGRAGGSYSVYFGSVPDMGEEVKGVKFADVRDGSPAAKAGLRGGDTLIRFDGQEIKNLYDFTYALKAHKPGQTVDVVVIRDGSELTVKVTLEKRE